MSQENSSQGSRAQGQVESGITEALADMKRAQKTQDTMIVQNSSMGQRKGQETGHIYRGTGRARMRRLVSQRPGKDHHDWAGKLEIRQEIKPKHRQQAGAGFDTGQQGIEEVSGAVTGTAARIR